MSERGQRKTMTGLVVSDRMQKSVVVSIDDTIRHPLYGKIYHRKTRITAHDEADDARVGDKVRLMETRPLSKTKRWRVVEVLERAR
jgi:small subunit ribosomal protein S17